MNHLTLDDYLAVLRGRSPVEGLIRKAEAHLREIDPDHGDGDGQDSGPSGGLPADPRLLSHTHLRAAKRRLSRMREAGREARKDLARLRKLPPSDWRQRVVNARTRFRSRAFAQLLLAEGHRLLPGDPTTAADLAALVPLALCWTGDRAELEWAGQLIAEAADLHASAAAACGAQNSKLR